jgi:Carboxypeptidase regulatory-like domain
MQTDFQQRLSPCPHRQVGSMRRIRRIVLLSAFLSLGTIPWAQKDAASIVGTVQDPSAAVVPKAEVRVMDGDRGTTFATSTGGSVDYVASPLKIGHYTVTVRKKDFKTAVIGPLELQVGQRRELNVKLEIGEVAESVHVSANPDLETQTSDRGQVVDNRTIIDLPLMAGTSASWRCSALALLPLNPGLPMKEPLVSVLTERDPIRTTISWMASTTIPTSLICRPEPATPFNPRLMRYKNLRSKPTATALSSAGATVLF